jgi:hypothetical protein
VAWLTWAIWAWLDGFLNLFLFATHFCFPSANYNYTKMIEVEVDRRFNGKLKRVRNLDI